MQLRKYVFLLGFMITLAGANAVGSPGDTSLQRPDNSTGAVDPSGDAPFRLLNNLAGVYLGTVRSGGHAIPISTEFFVDKDGNISGAYTMTESSGIVEGMLYEFRSEGGYTLTATWRDKYGSGALRMIFSHDGHLFRGFWGPDDQHAMMQWDGTKKQ